MVRIGMPAERMWAKLGCSFGCARYWCGSKSPDNLFTVGWPYSKLLPDESRDSAFEFLCLRRRRERRRVKRSMRLNIWRHERSWGERSQVLLSHWPLRTNTGQFDLILSLEAIYRPPASSSFRQRVRWRRRSHHRTRCRGYSSS